MKLLFLTGLAFGMFLFEANCGSALTSSSIAPSPTPETKKYDKDSEVPRISVADAKKDYDAGTALIVDARGAASYEQERIAKAINIPFGSSDFSSVPKGKKIIIYCS